MTLASRIREAMGDKSPADIARATKKTESAVSQWLDGTTKSLRADTAAMLEAATGYRAAWISTGKGAKRADNVAPATLGSTRIPLISSVQAGVWTEVVDNFSPGDAQDWLMTDQRLSKRAFALEIKGLSMLPEFKPGDRIIIDPDVAPHPGDFVVAKNGEDEATFKKYRPRGSDASGNAIFELVPLNEDFESIRSDAQPIRVIGTMVEHRKYRNRDQK